jgi:hypothetical protein
MRCLLPALVVAATLSACGLSTVGQLDEPAGQGVDPPPGPAPPSNTSALPASDEGGTPVPPPPPPPPPGCNPSCALPQAAGFTLALFGDRTAACPDDYDPTDAVEGPTAGAGACTCGTCVMTGTTCNTGTIPSRYASNNQCGNTGASLQANGGNCFNFSGTFGTYASVLPPAAVPGTCSAPGVAVRANVTASSRRICALKAGACGAGACALPAAQRACLVAPGDVACPAGAPTKHLVAGDFTLACAACSCSTAATCGGSMTFYSNAGCTGSTITMNASTCTQVNGASIASTRWTGTVATQQCANLTPGAATVGLSGATSTVCCP